MLASFYGANAIAIDWVNSPDIIYIADLANCCIRKFNQTSNLVSTFGGSCANPGYKDGPVTSSLFYWPRSIRYLSSSSGTKLLVADANTNSIRMIDIPLGLFLLIIITTKATATTHSLISLISIILFHSPHTEMVSTLAGTGTAGFQDGPSSLALLSAPFNMCDDGNGNVYVADINNHVIRLININSGQGIIVFYPFPSPYYEKVNNNTSPLPPPQFQHMPETETQSCSMALLWRQDFSRRMPWFIRHQSRRYMF